MKKRLPLFSIVLFSAAFTLNVSVSQNGHVQFINKANALQQTYQPIIGQCVDVDGTIYSGGVICGPGTQAKCTPQPCVPL